MKKGGFTKIERAAFVSILAVVLAVFSVFAVRLNQEKGISIDEFQYAHASWLISKGQLPYRDFFEVHFPLVYQYLSFFWLFGSGSPANVIFLRLLMLPVVLIGLLSLARLTHSQEKLLEGMMILLFALSCLPFISFATEIRPDAIAFSFYVAAVAVLYRRGFSGKVTAFWSGLFLALSLWGSQKAWFYGLPLIVIWGIAVVMAARKKRWILNHPAWFALGATTVGAPIVAYMTLTGSWASFYKWCFRWAYDYQLRYPGFSWWSVFKPVAITYPILIILAIIGVGVVLHRKEMDRDVAEKECASSLPEYILAASLVTAFFSFALQRAPWIYSAIPLLGFLCVFAGRGLGALLYWVRGRISGKPARVALILSFFLLSAWYGITCGSLLTYKISQDNHYQIHVLNMIDRLTFPSDAIYDNSGGYVSRPHAYFYFYTEKSIRVLEAERLIHEVPEAIEKSEAMFLLKDFRYKGLPEELKEYLESNFQSYNGDLWIWGGKISGTGHFKFRANKTGKYFIVPLSGSFGPSDSLMFIRSAGIRIDGTPVAGSIFSLEKGQHLITVENESGPFYVLWVPRNREIWIPRPNIEQKFSKIF